MKPVTTVAFLILLLYIIPSTAEEVEDEESLQAAVLDASPASTIDITSREIVLTASLNISSQNLTLSGRRNSKTTVVCPVGGSAIFANGSVKLENIVFRECNGSSAIRFEIESPDQLMEVSNCEFQSNRLGENFNGAAINLRCRDRCLDGVARLVVSNSTFEDNAADQGGAVYAINSQIDIKDSVFRNNTSNYGGSAICARQTGGSVRASVEVTNTSFEGNRAVRVGLADELTDEQGKRMEIIRAHMFQAPLATGGACLVKDVHNVSFVNCTFRQNEAAAGGALSTIYDSTKTNPTAEDAPSLRIAECFFSHNRAIHTELGRYRGTHEVRLGGAMYMALNIDRMSVEVTRCNFTHNLAVHGGAVHFVASNSLSATFEECRFKRNTATMFGGAAIVRSIGLLIWRNVNSTDNLARQGGALYLTNNAGFRIVGLPRGYRPQGNMTRSRFARNMAVDGGAIMCSACGTATLQDPTMNSNVASRFGGAIYILDCAVNFYMQHARIKSNQALAGGAVAVESSVRFALNVEFDSEAEANHLSKNVAAVGGAVYYLANRQGVNSMELRGCIFRRNQVVSLESLLPTLQRAEARVLADDAEPHGQTYFRRHLSRACQEGGGGAVCLELSVIPLQASAGILVQDTSFHRNNGTIGGALYVSTSGSEWKTSNNGSCLSGSEMSDECRTLQFQRVNFTQNTASQGGGAVFVSDSDDVVCICGIRSTSNDTLTTVVETFSERPNANFTTELFCTLFQNNSVKMHGGVYGPHVATNAFSLELVHPKTPVVNHGSGDFLICDGETDKNCRGYVLLVKDRFSQRITGGNPAASMELNVQSESLNGNLRYTAKEGEVNVNRIQGIASKEKRTSTKFHDISFEAMGGLELSLTTNFSFRDCVVGEISELVCRECQENYYSFQPDLECLSCEQHGNCTGGAALLPEDGYWHSTPFSPLFHECLVEEACTYPGRSVALAGFYKDSDLNLTAEPVSNEAYPQCREGYTGTLCGSCDDGYGRFSDGTCSHCDSSHGTTVLLMIGLTLWIALLVGFEVLTTLNTNHSFKEIQRLRGERGNRDQGTLSAPTSSRKIPGSLNRIPGASVSVSYASLDSRLGINTEDVPQHIAASEKLAELIKIFVNFLQITSVAVSMNLRWGAVLEQFLRAEEIVATATNGATYLPLECTLGEQLSSPGSIVALWSRIIFPFLLLFAFLAFGFAYWFAARRNQTSRNVPWSERYRLSDLYTYFIVASIAVSFFAYKDVTEELMRTVSCLHLDGDEEADEKEVESDHPYIKFAVAHEAYWAEDTQQICWKDDHLPTGIVGIFGLVIFSAGAIIFIVFFLVYNKPKLRDEGFIARYGFLYRSYKLHWYTIPWEGVIAVRKALVSAAIVFAFPLGPNLQAVMSLGVLILAQAVHLVCWPFTDYRTSPNVPQYSGTIVAKILGQHYRKKWVKFNNNVSLNHLESASLLVSTLTFYAGIVFYDNKTSDAGEVALTVFVAFSNFLYIFYMLYRIYHGFHVMLNAIIDNIRTNRNIETDIQFVDGEGIFKLVRRVNQLFLYYWRGFRGRLKPSASGSTEPMRQSAANVEQQLAEV